MDLSSFIIYNIPTPYLNKIIFTPTNVGIKYFNDVVSLETNNLLDGNQNRIGPGTSVNKDPGPLLSEGQKMSTEVKTIQYNKSLRAQIMLDYESNLEDAGLPESIIKGHVWAARAFLEISPKDPKDLDQDEFDKIEAKVRKKFSKRTVQMYLPNIGHFLQYYIGRNPYMDDSTHFQSLWMDRVKNT